MRHHTQVYNKPERSQQGHKEISVAKIIGNRLRLRYLIILDYLPDFMVFFDNGKEIRQNEKVKVQPLNHKGTNKSFNFMVLSKSEEKCCKYGIYCTLRIIS